MASTFRTREKTLSKITRSARGQPCQIRLPGCDGGGPTTVFCHYSLSGLSGMAIKSGDVFGAYGRYTCHAIVDGHLKRPAEYSRADVRLAHAEGCFRTQALLVAQGLVNVLA